MRKKQLKSRLQCAGRMNLVFWKTGSRLKFAGVKTFDTEGNSCIVSSPKQVQTALAEHWTPVYSKKVFGQCAAELLLADYQKRNADLIANFSRCQMPTKERFTAIIKKVKDSATGPNGIPYSAYAACPDISASVLENTTELFG